MGKVGPAGGEGRVGGPATADAPPTPFASFAVASAPAVSDTVAPQHAPAAGTAAQLAPAVLALHRRGADGTHVMTVEVTPEALGRVRVEVELRDGQVALTIAGGSDAARDALRAALPELRRVLEAAGVNTGTLAVSPDDAGSGQPGAQSGAQPGGQFGAGQPDGGRPHHERPAWQSARSDPREAQPERPAPPGRTGAMSLDLQL